MNDEALDAKIKSNRGKARDGTQEVRAKSYEATDSQGETSGATHAQVRGVDAARKKGVGKDK